MSSLLGSTALRFDDEQAMLLEYAGSFCRDHGGSERVRERLESPLDYTPDLWRQMVDMGWTGIGLPESLGGSGLGIAAAVPVFERMGRALLGTPLMSSLLAAQLLLRAGGEAGAERLQAIAAGSIVAIADLESSDWSTPRAARVDATGRLSGRKRLVMDGGSADLFLVIARRGDADVVAVIPRAALADDALSPATLLDLTHRAVDIEFREVPVLAVLDGAAVTAALRDYRLLGALLVAAESAGAAAACLDTICDYLKTRTQFGKPIGAYQALKHPAVEILAGVDNARSFIYHAASIVHEGALDHDAEVACRMAKAQATETLRYAGDRAVQFHGGMGFTWECDAQLYIRRAQWAQQQYGDAQHHRRVLGELLLASG
jgi:alkylation response protein AidB-like acyl-CoA dehydrogenase